MMNRSPRRLFRGLDEHEDHIHLFVGLERSLDHDLIHLVHGLVDARRVQEHELRAPAGS